MSTDGKQETEAQKPKTLSQELEDLGFQIIPGTLVWLHIENNIRLDFGTSFPVRSMEQFEAGLAENGQEIVTRVIALYTEGLIQLDLDEYDFIGPIEEVDEFDVPELIQELLSLFLSTAVSLRPDAVIDEAFFAKFETEDDIVCPGCGEKDCFTIDAIKQAWRQWKTQSSDKGQSEASSKPEPPPAPRPPASAAAEVPRSPAEKKPATPPVPPIQPTRPPAPPAPQSPVTVSATPTGTEEVKVTAAPAPPPPFGGRSQIPGDNKLLGNQELTLEKDPPAAPQQESSTKPKVPETA